MEKGKDVDIDVGSGFQKDCRTVKRMILNNKYPPPLHLPKENWEEAAVHRLVKYGNISTFLHLKDHKVSRYQDISPCRGSKTYNTFKRKEH